MLGHALRTGSPSSGLQVQRAVGGHMPGHDGNQDSNRKDAILKKSEPHGGSSGTLHSQMNAKITLPNLWELLKRAFSRWNEDHAPQQGAALAYYAVFSLAPLMIVITIAGFVFGQEAAQGQLIEQIKGLVGEKSAQAIQSMIEEARKPTVGIIVTVVAVVMLLFGAT